MQPPQAPPQEQQPEQPQVQVPPVMDFSTMIAQTIAATMAAMAQQQPPPPPVAPVQPAVPAVERVQTWTEIRTAFLKGNPPEFKGSTEILEALQWRQDIERHLRMAEGTGVQMQMLASFRLAGEALQWWESVTTPAQRSTLTIEEFWQKFEAKYFPISVQKGKKKEFLNLKQGDRTVAEYEREFTNLS